MHLSNPMECHDYEGVLKSLRSGVQANIEIFSDVTSLLSLLNTSFATFISSLPKIDTSLPTKRRRSSLFRGLSGMVDFPNAEKQFSENWRWMFNEIAELPTLGQAFGVHFFPIFDEIWKSFERDFKAIEERYTKALATLRDEQAAYDDQRKKYETFCQSLENKHNSHSSDFSTAKAGYPIALEEVIASLQRFNEAKMKAGVEIENCLLEFETIDRTRNEAIDSLLKNMAGVLPQYRGRYSELLVGLRKRVGEISSQSDVEDSVDMLGRTGKIEMMDMDIPGFDFPVTEFMDYKQAFEEDMKKWTGKVNETVCNGELAAGAFVTVNEENGSSLVVETESGKVFTVDASKVEKAFERKLARVDEEYDVLNPGEVVLVINESDSGIDVMNVFGTVLTLAADKVTFM